MKQRKFRAFIIHAFKDISLIEKIKEELENNQRIQVIIAERRNKYGDILSQKLMDLIDSSHMVLVVWSHNLEKSVLANQEIGYAMGRDKTICPFVMSGMEPKGLLEATEYMVFDPYDIDDYIVALVNEVKRQARILSMV